MAKEAWKLVPRTVSPRLGYFVHGGSQAVRLPMAFRFQRSEVLIEKHGDEVVLRPVTHSQFKSFTEMARHLAENFLDAEDFPEPPPRPTAHERAILEF